MPNWTYGSYAIKGKKENVLNFLNEGLKNSKLKPQSSCSMAVDVLLTNAKTKTYNVVSSSINNPRKVIYGNGLTLDTFRPMPDTFIMWDTTNYKKELKNIAKYQKRKYGVIGWYDYGIEKLRGVKWDTDLSNFRLSYEDDNIAVVEFDADTAWTYPFLWLEWVKNTFNVNVLLCVHEESNSFNFYGEIDECEKDFGDFSPYKTKKEDYDNEHDYYEALCEEEMEKVEEMNNEFEQFVENYQIEDFD